MTVAWLYKTSPLAEQIAGALLLLSCFLVTIIFWSAVSKPPHKGETKTDVTVEAASLGAELGALALCFCDRFAVHSANRCVLKQQHNRSSGRASLAQGSVFNSVQV